MKGSTVRECVRLRHPPALVIVSHHIDRDPFYSDMPPPTSYFIRDQRKKIKTNPAFIGWARTLQVDCYPCIHFCKHAGVGFTLSDVCHHRFWWMGLVIAAASWLLCRCMPSGQHMSLESRLGIREGKEIGNIN